MFNLRSKYYLIKLKSKSVAKRELATKWIISHFNNDVLRHITKIIVHNNSHRSFEQIEQIYSLLAIVDNKNVDTFLFERLYTLDFELAQLCLTKRNIDEKSLVQNYLSVINSAPDSWSALRLRSCNPSRDICLPVLNAVRQLSNFYQEKEKKYPYPEKSKLFLAISMAASSVDYITYFPVQEHICEQMDYFISIENAALLLGLTHDDLESYYLSMISERYHINKDVYTLRLGELKSTKAIPIILDNYVKCDTHHISINNVAVKVLRDLNVPQQKIICSFIIHAVEGKGIFDSYAYNDLLEILKELGATNNETTIALLYVFIQIDDIYYVSDHLFKQLKDAGLDKNILEILKLSKCELTKCRLKLEEFFESSNLQDFDIASNEFIAAKQTFSRTPEMIFPDSFEGHDPSYDDDPGSAPYIQKPNIDYTKARNQYIAAGRNLRSLLVSLILPQYDISTLNE